MRVAGVTRRSWLMSDPVTIKLKDMWDMQAFSAGDLSAWCVCVYESEKVLSLVADVQHLFSVCVCVCVCVCVYSTVAVR